MPDNDWTIKELKAPQKKSEKVVTKEVLPQYAPPPPALPMTQKNAERLLHLLVHEHKFDLVKEIVTLYREAGDLENILEKLKIQKSIVKDLLKYCFPVIASEQAAKETAGVKINFNLHTNKDMFKSIGDGSIMDADYTEDV